MKTKLALIVCLVTSGCVTESTVERQLALCPNYFRQNIGKPVVKPVSLYSFAYAGYVNTADDKHFYLFATANEDVILEEAFHSFELRAYRYRRAEWTRFFLAYDQQETWTEHLESAADDFIALIRQKGCNPAIDNFVNGEYQK